MFIGLALDESLVLERVEPIDHRFVRRNLAAELDFADKRSDPVLEYIPMKKTEHRVLFFGECVLNQIDPRLWRKLPYKDGANVAIF